MKIHHRTVLNWLIYGSYFLILSSFETKYSIIEKINFTLQNDLNYTIHIQIGKTKLSLNAGSAYKFAKASGEKIYYIQSNGKNKLILTVQKETENKIFKLSKLIFNTP
jgi:hypothetical protein